MKCNKCNNMTEDWHSDDWFCVERGNDRAYIFCSPKCVQQFLFDVHKMEAENWRLRIT